MRPAPAVANRQHGVFTTRQALDAGWTKHALVHAVEHGHLVRLRPGVFAVPLDPVADRFATAEAELRRAGYALGLTHRRMPLSHRTAASLHGLALLQPTTTPCVTYPRAFRGKVSNAHLHRAHLWTGDVVRRGEVLLTAPARTVVDLGRELGADDCVVAADSALRLGLTTSDLLARVTADCAGWPGLRRAAHALAHTDPRAESALESISRLRMVQAELPAPWTQPTIHIDGRFAGRVDFYWDEFGVVGEADGLAKYDGRPLSLREEKRRQGALERAGLIFVRWGWDDLDPFDAVAAELQAAFARGQRPDRAPRGWRATCHPIRTAR